MNQAARLRGWTPLRIRPAEGRLVVDWCHLGSLRFVEGCFEQTVSAALRQPARIFFLQTTPVEVLEGFGGCGSIPPTGFIFHLSRSGSNLLSRMLAACPRNIVIAQAPPIDTVLRAAALDPASRLRHLARLRGLIHALGQRRGKTAAYLFVAFDSWHALDLPLILEAFPNTPWIFLFRDPVEVLASHQRIRGLHVVPGAIGTRSNAIGPVGPAFAGLDDYGARVLAEIGRAALANAHRGRARFIHARQLPGVLETELERFFDVDYTGGETSLMHMATRPDDASALTADPADSAADLPAGSPGLQAIAAPLFSDLYARLQERCHQRPEPAPAVARAVFSSAR